MLTRHSRLVNQTPIIRSKNNIHKPIQKLNLSDQLQLSASLEPTIVTQAVKDSKWLQAMSDEYNALIQNDTWERVPPDPRQNIVGHKWIF